MIKILSADISARYSLDNRVKTITVYRGDDNVIEGIKVSSWSEENISRPSGAQTTDFFQKTRSFGNTDKNENICAECVMNLDKDESITVLSYRKSKVWDKNYLIFIQPCIRPGAFLLLTSLASPTHSV